MAVRLKDSFDAVSTTVNYLHKGKYRGDVMSTVELHCSIFIILHTILRIRYMRPIWAILLYSCCATSCAYFVTLQSKIVKLAA